MFRISRTSEYVDDIVDDYYQKIYNTHISVPKIINDFDLNGNPVQINLDCWYLSKAVKPKGFTIAANGKYQYNLRRQNLERPIAWRVPFLALFPEEFHDDDYTVSHLCHDENCYNPHHHWFEPLPVNKGRNGCPGPNHGCRHLVKCLIPGPYCNQ